MKTSKLPCGTEGIYILLTYLYKTNFKCISLKDLPLIKLMAFVAIDKTSFSGLLEESFCQ